MLRLLQMPAPITMRQFSARLTQLTLTWSAHSLAGLVDETVQERDEARARVAELEDELTRVRQELDDAIGDVFLLREDVEIGHLAASEIGLLGDVGPEAQSRAWEEAREHRRLAQPLAAPLSAEEQELGRSHR